MKYFAVTYTYGQDTQLVDDTRPTHREWIKEQIAAGTVIAAGPLIDGGRQALLIIRQPEEATQDDVETLLNQDPYNVAGALASFDIRPWNAVANTFES